MTAFFDYAGFSLHRALNFAPVERDDVHSAASLRERIEDTRAAIATSLGLTPPHVFLTMGTTRGFKQLLLHTAWFPDSGHVVASDLMYPKMYRALRVRCPHVEVAPVSIAADGAAIAHCLAEKVGSETSAVVVDAVDNRRGLAVDLKILREAVQHRNPRTLIVLDASQAYGQLPQLIESADLYDMLVADLKKWCRYKSQTGLGFVAVPGADHAAQLVETTNSQFALHPTWLPTPVAAMLGEMTMDEPTWPATEDGEALIGRADAGGADLLGWCGAAPFVERAMASLNQVNHLRAQEFLSQVGALQGPWRCWPAAPSSSNTGIVSLVGAFEPMFLLHRKLQEQGIACSLIPTNLPPLPAALEPGEACLRFSFHDQYTSDEELTRLLHALQAGA